MGGQRAAQGLSHGDALLPRRCRQGVNMVKVLFVCTGNICRSPTAEGVFRQVIRDAGLDDRIATDSAGTHGYHVGEPPDSRSVAAARSRGVDIADLRARRVKSANFD